jgi:hypothetical protein
MPTFACTSTPPCRPRWTRATRCRKTIATPDRPCAAPHTGRSNGDAAIVPRRHARRWEEKRHCGQATGGPGVGMRLAPAQFLRGAIPPRCLASRGRDS